MMQTAIIIDDEMKGRIALKQKLLDHCPDIKLIGEADSGKQWPGIYHCFESWHRFH